MERKNTKSLQIPNELISDLEEKINNLYSGSITDGFIFYLNKNIEILKRENIIFQEVKIIKKIGLKNENQIEYGYFTENVIKHVFQRKNAGRGKIKLIKALIIAVYAEKWEDVFNYYFDQNGLKKSVIIEVKKNSKIKINSTEKLQINNKQRVKGIEILFREKIWKKNLFFLLLFLLLFSVFFNPTKNYISNKFNKSKVKKEQVKIYKCEPFVKTNNNYNILILPFEPLEQCLYKKTNIEKSIMSRLIDMSFKDTLNLKIKFDTSDCIHNSKEAEEIGKALNADLIIFGDLYEHCSEYNEATIKFINLLPPKLSPLKKQGSFGDIKFNSLLDVKEGSLLNKIDFIIHFVVITRTFSLKNYSLTLKYFQSFKNRGFELEEVYEIAALIYSNLKETNNSIIYLKKVLKINPNNYKAHYLYATLLAYDFKNYEMANSQFELAINLAIKLDSNPSDIIIGYAYFLEEKIKDYQKAKENYEKALNYNPYSIENHINYANFLKNKCYDYQNSKKHYEKALEINPYSLQANLRYAILMDHNFNNNDIAEYHYKKTLEIDPNNNEALLYSIPILIQKYHNLKAAKFQLEKLLEINPNYVDAHLVYADFIYSNYKDTLDAKKHYEIALKIDPNDGNANFYYSIFLYNILKNTKEAKRYYLRSKKIDPSYIDKLMEKLL